MLTRRGLLQGTTALCAAAALGSLFPARAASQLPAADQAAFLAEAEPDAWRGLIDRVQASGEASAPSEALQSSEALTGLAKRITKLWYSGWTEPADSVAPAVRASAYRESLAWRALALPPRGTPTGRLWQSSAD